MECSEDESIRVPMWMVRMFTASKFYDSCEDHCSKPAKYYCTICMVIVCEDRMEQYHKKHGHTILTKLKAYKSSRVAAFRIDDLKGVWKNSCSGIKQHKINGHLIVYVNQKGGVHRSGSPTGDPKCENCQYKISDTSNFCSLECKVKVALKKIEERKAEALNRAKRDLEMIEGESPSDLPKKIVAAGQSFRKRPRKQSNPKRSPLF